MHTLIYCLPFGLLALLSFLRPRTGFPGAAAAAGLLIIWVGLRHQVGDDWDNYLSWVEAAKGADIATVLQSTDPGYALLNWMGANWFGGIYLVNFTCAVLAIIPLVIFCSRQVNPTLALLVAYPYLVTVVYMGYSRQSVAVGLGMLAMLAVQERGVRKFLAFVTIAAVFHKTAVCLLVFAPALFAGKWDRAALVRLGGVIVYGAVLVLAVLWSHAASLIQGYIVTAGEAAFPPSAGEGSTPLAPPSALSPVQSTSPETAVPLMPASTAEQRLADDAIRLYSAGALARIAQSVVAAVGFIVIASRIRLPAPTRWLWTIASAVVVCLFALAFWRSTLADRTALFFVPLQLYAFSTLPSLFGRVVSHFVQAAIVGCSAAAFGIWLAYGDNAPSWLPYQSVLQSWL